MQNMDKMATTVTRMAEMFEQVIKIEKALGPFAGILLFSV